MEKELLFIFSEPGSACHAGPIRLAMLSRRAGSGTRIKLMGKTLIFTVWLYAVGFFRQAMNMKNQTGLILIELIMTIVLIGIIASFTGFFIYSGINGYIRAQYISNGSLDAQRALDRISLELRDITNITPTPTATAVTYTSAAPALTGTRTLKYEVNTNTIFIRVEPNDYALLENVSSFNLSYDTRNLDNDPAPVDEVAYIEVEFNLRDIGTKFKARIFPRNLVTRTWP